MLALAESAPKSDKPAPQVGDIKVNVGGMQVSIDPATGRLRPPTLEESRALARALQQQFTAPSQPLQVIHAANGAVAVELPEETMETVLLRNHADGTQTIECMSAAEAARILEGEAAAVAPPVANSHRHALPARQGAGRTAAEKE
jgi:hypothetical protein